MYVKCDLFGKQMWKKNGRKFNFTRLREELERLFTALALPCIILNGRPQDSVKHFHGRVSFLSNRLLRIDNNSFSAPRVVLHA